MTTSLTFRSRFRCQHSSCYFSTCRPYSFEICYSDFL